MFCSFTSSREAQFVSVNSAVSVYPSVPYMRNVKFRLNFVIGLFLTNEPPKIIFQDHFSE
jgi:hypothetical protein